MPVVAGNQTLALTGQPEWREDVGTITATWTDPLGQEWRLSDTSEDLGYFTTNGIAGWGAAPVELVTDPLSRGGEQVRFIRVQPRRLTWPLHIWGDNHMEFITRYRNLMRAFTLTTHRRAPGYLTVRRPDGTGRFIACYYEDGFGGEGGENWLSANPVLTLFCPDGYWSDIQPQTVPRAFGAAPSSFYSPFMTIGSSQVLGSTEITNIGDVDAWPSWTITGPMARVVASNNSTGDSFALTYALTAGQQITITTNRPTVRGPGGSNLTGALDWPNAVLWPLLPGSNDVDFQVDGAAAGTSIQLTYYPRYEGA